MLGLAHFRGFPVLIMVNLTIQHGIYKVEEALMFLSVNIVSKAFTAHVTQHRTIHIHLSDSLYWATASVQPKLHRE